MGAGSVLEEFADRAGLSSSAIGMYERGQRVPHIKTIYFC
ncbi:helix-turn-helix domain-containing protein [Paenibacillus maysiensis]